MAGQNFFQSIASDLGPCVYVHTIYNNMARIQKENIMITLENIDNDYHYLMSLVSRDESISSFEKKFISQGISMLMKQIEASVDKNIEQAYSESL